MDMITTDFENWGPYLMKQFQLMYERGERCDLEISCNKQIFLVHRLILSSCSEYVRELGDKQHIILPEEVSCKAIKAIIDFVYTGKILYSKDEKDDLLLASNLLHMRLLSELIKMEESCSFTLSMDEDAEESKGSENSNNNQNVDMRESTDLVIDEQTSDHSSASSPTVKKKEVKGGRSRKGKNVMLPPLFRFPYLQQKFSSSRTYGLITILTEPIPSRFDIPESILEGCTFRSSFEDITYETEIYCPYENICYTLQPAHLQFLKKMKESPAQKRSYANALFSPFDKYTPPYNMNVEASAPRKREPVASYLATAETPVAKRPTPVQKSQTPKKSVTFAKELEIIVECPSNCEESIRLPVIPVAPTKSAVTCLKTSQPVPPIPEVASVTLIDITLDETDESDMELPPAISPVSDVSNEAIQSPFSDCGEKIELTKLNNVAVPMDVEELEDPLHIDNQYEAAIQEATITGAISTSPKSDNPDQSISLVSLPSQPVERVVGIMLQQNELQPTDAAKTLQHDRGEATIAFEENELTMQNQIPTNEFDTTPSTPAEDTGNSQMSSNVLAITSTKIACDTIVRESAQRKISLRNTRVATEAESQANHSLRPCVIDKVSATAVMLPKKSLSISIPNKVATMVRKTITGSVISAVPPSHSTTTETVESSLPPQFSTDVSLAKTMSRQLHANTYASKSVHQKSTASALEASKAAAPLVDTKNLTVGNGPSNSLPLLGTAPESRICQSPLHNQTSFIDASDTQIVAPMLECGQLSSPSCTTTPVFVYEAKRPLTSVLAKPAAAAMQTISVDETGEADCIAGPTTNTNNLVAATDDNQALVKDDNADVVVTKANLIDSILSDSNVFTAIDKRSVSQISTDPNSQMFALKVKGTENAAQLSQLVNLCRKNSLFKNKNVKFKIVPVKGPITKSWQEHIRQSNNVPSKTIIVQQTSNSKLGSVAPAKNAVDSGSSSEIFGPAAATIPSTTTVPTSTVTSVCSLAAKGSTDKNVSSLTIRNRVPMAPALPLSIENVAGPWECGICCGKRDASPLKFNSYLDYRTHLHSAHNEANNPIYCIHCGHKSLKRNMQLYHLFVKHNVQPPPNFHFPKCDKCEFHALNEYYLQKHQSCHQSVAGMEYVCSCKVAFKTSELLQQHMASNDCKNSNSFSCGYCNCQFSRFVNLKAHMRLCMKERSKQIVANATVAEQSANVNDSSADSIAANAEDSDTAVS